MTKEDPMIVCSCAVVSDRRLSAEIVAGARSVEELASRTGAGAHCGSCRCDLVALLTAPPLNTAFDVPGPRPVDTRASVEATA
jgi:bacterioferritin-associated ferredoxin